LKSIAFIPSKGNSEGIPKKNLQRIGDHSLVEWSLEFAVESKEFESIVISTESIEIVENTSRLSQYVDQFEKLKDNQILDTSDNIQLHKRSKALATQSASTLDLLDSFLQAQNIEVDTCVTLLQPTCPFRSILELSIILNLVRRKEFHSVASARLFDSPHPQKALRLLADSSVDANDLELDLLSSPRQALAELFVLDGAYYCVDVAQFKKTKRLVSTGTHIIKRKGVSTVNIDNEDDLHYARFIFETKKKLIPWTPVKESF
jgi:CMP-N-acetylneuraminic acid synthetase